MFGRFSLAILALALTACQEMPEVYAPPVQREPVEAFRPYRISRIVAMSDADASQHFVTDIAGDGGSWSWTAQRPTVKVTLRSTENIRYWIDFTLPEVTFKETGPVNVSFFVNDRLLETVRYTQPGDQHFEKPVPSDWLQKNQDTTVAAEIDKVFVAPQDGSKLGMILTRIGLTQ